MVERIIFIFRTTRSLAFERYHDSTLHHLPLGAVGEAIGLLKGRACYNELRARPEY